jgi:hypothetical protein
MKRLAEESEQLQREIPEQCHPFRVNGKVGLPVLDSLFGSLAGGVYDPLCPDIRWRYLEGKRIIHIA